jgi:hypothetical protein
MARGGGRSRGEKKWVIFFKLKRNRKRTKQKERPTG